LYLVALRTLISSHCVDVCATTGGVDFRPYVHSVIPHLLSGDDEEKGTRTIIAECLGRLGIIDPARVAPTISAAFESTSVARRVIATLALKFAVSKKKTGDDEEVNADTTTSGGGDAKKKSDSVPNFDRSFRPLMRAFLRLVQDSSLDIVGAALIALNAIAHHRAVLLHDLFVVVPDGTGDRDRSNGGVVDSLWPSLLDHMQIKKHLKRTINLGPFKEKIDDGLPLRKAAYACVDTMLKKMPSFIDVKKVTPALKNGLSERDPDVKMLCYSIVQKLCARDDFYDAVLPNLGSLLGPLDRTIKKRASKKASHVSKDQRARQLLFAAVRVVEALGRIPSIRKDAAFAALWGYLEEKGLRSEDIANSSKDPESGHGGTKEGE